MTLDKYHRYCADCGEKVHIHTVECRHCGSREKGGRSR